MLCCSVIDDFVFLVYVVMWVKKNWNFYLDNIFYVLYDLGIWNEVCCFLRVGDCCWKCFWNFWRESLSVWIENEGMICKYGFIFLCVI